MKKREEIVKNVGAYPYDMATNTVIELLLDIRELLISQNKPHVFLTPTQAVDELVLSASKIPKIHFFMPSGSIACAKKGSLSSHTKLEEVTCDDCKAAWHELMNPPVDCNVIPDPKKLLKMKKKLDKQLSKISSRKP